MEERGKEGEYMNVKEEKERECIGGDETEGMSRLRKPVSHTVMITTHHEAFSVESRGRNLKMQLCVWNSFNS